MLFSSLSIFVSHTYTPFRDVISLLVSAVGLLLTVSVTLPVSLSLCVLSAPQLGSASDSLHLPVLALISAISVSIQSGLPLSPYILWGFHPLQLTPS